MLASEAVPQSSSSCRQRRTSLSKTCSTEDASVYEIIFPPKSLDSAFKYLKLTAPLSNMDILRFKILKLWMQVCFGFYETAVRKCIKWNSIFGNCVQWLVLFEVPTKIWLFNMTVLLVFGLFVGKFNIIYCVANSVA